MRFHIKELREKGKNPLFCQGVTPTEFDKIFNLLKNNYDKNLKESEILDILATLANIVLINRSLHYEHFTPNCSKDLLAILAKLIDEGIISKQSVQPEKRHFNFVAVYRLVFLILYDNKGIDEENAEVLGQQLQKAFKMYCDNFGTFASDANYQLSFNELLKSLYTLYHQHKGIKRTVCNSECIRIANRLLELRRLQNADQGPKFSFTDLEMMLMKSMLNLNLIVLDVDKTTAGQERNEPVHYTPFEEEEAEEAKLCYTNAVDLLLFELELYDLQNENKHASKESKTAFVLADILAVLAIFRTDYRNILGTIEECGTDVSKQAFKKSLLDLKQRFWYYFIPSDDYSELYNQLFQLTLLSHPSVNLVPSEITHAAHIRSLIFDLYFEICESIEPDSEESSNSEDGLLELFLLLFGYSYSISYFLRSDTVFPSEEMKQKYMNPTSKYLKKPPSSLDNSSDRQPLEIIDTLFNREFRNLSMKDKQAPEKIDEPMTSEEKEREAEKLFTLLSRVEKNPVFEGFVNPVREWQQSGKFEDLQ